MADAPKPKKEESKKEGLTLFEQTILLLFALYAISLIWWRLNDFFLYYNGGPNTFWSVIVSYFFTHIVPLIKVVALVVTFLALWGLVRAHMRLTIIEKHEKEMYGMKAVDGNAGPVMKNERWERIITHLNSPNASDWRLAIIEADIMLDELLKSRSFHGDTLGERLKSVDKSDMLTLDNAWEAHRVRNQIAHQGADYSLTEREAKRAITLYESVFKEFKII